MPKVLGNVNLDKVSDTRASGRREKSTLRKPVRLHGEWNLDPSKPYQSSTEIAFESGKQLIEIDSPPYLGYNENRFGPMPYCVAGISSCFVATFSNLAASDGIRLTKLSVIRNAK